MKTPTLGDFLRLDKLILEGNKEVVLQFIEKNNITNETYMNLTGDCSSPLYTGARCGQLDIVSSLIARGLTIHHRWECSPVHIAARNGHLSVVTSLFKDHGYDINAVDLCGETPLHNAVTENNLDVVKYLVDAGAGVNHANSAGLTLLHHAIQSLGKQTEMCEYILSHGFSAINSQDNNGNTALFLATLLGMEQLTNMLLDNGANVTIGNYKNMTPFWAASCNCSVDILQRLYSLGADPEVEMNGTTPIISAAENGRINVVHYLAVDLNVSLNKPNGRFHSPLYAALKKGRWNIAMLLLQAGSQMNGDEYSLLLESVEKCTENKEVERFFTEVLFKPMRLADICCFAVRRILGRNININSNLLPLPYKLMNYVKLTHVPYKS